MEVSEEDMAEGLDECERSIVVRVLSEAEVNAKGLRSVMMKAWGFSHLRVFNRGANIFHIFMEEEQAVQKALYAGPWNFDHFIFFSSFRNGKRWGSH